MNFMNHRSIKTVASLLIVAVPLIGVVRPACGGDNVSFWITETGGLFHDPGNWDGPVPDETVVAVFDLAGTYEVAFGALAASDRVLLRNGDVTFLLKNFTYSVDNPLFSTPSLAIGESVAASAELNIQGGTLETRFVNIGHAVNSFGSLLVGPGAALVSDLSVHVGASGNGWLEITDGGMVSNLVANIGLEEGAFGLATISGADALWSTQATLTVGEQGIGDLFILNGAAVTSQAGIIGGQFGSIGNVTVIGPGSGWFVDGPLDVGQNGFGSLLISGGGEVSTAGFATIGTFIEPDPKYPKLGGEGEVAVVGTGAVWEIGGDLHVGLFSTGLLEIADGGAVFSNNGFVNTLGSSIHPATVSVTGDGSIWWNAGDLLVRDLLEVRAGGLVAAESLDIAPYGTLQGDAAVQGFILNRGAIRPDGPPGDPYDPSIATMEIIGDYEQDPSGTLFIEVGYDVVEFDWITDVLEITGTATLSGTLEVPDVSADPHSVVYLDIITAESVTGEFDTLIAERLCCGREWTLIYTDTTVRLSTEPLPEGDLDGDGSVGVKDLLILLGSWGPCADCNDCPADIDGDCSVGVTDLLILLGNWG